MVLDIFHDFREDAKKAKEGKISFEGRRVGIDYADITKRKKKTPRKPNKTADSNVDSQTNRDDDDDDDSDREANNNGDIKEEDGGDVDDDDDNEDVKPKIQHDIHVKGEEKCNCYLKD